MTTFLRTLTWALGIASASVACAQDSPEKFVGCYRFAPSVLDVSGRRLAFDTVLVELDSTRLSPMPGDTRDLRRLLPAVLAGIREVPGMSFRPSWHVTADSVHLVWTNGFGIVAIELRQRADSLVGEARFYTDVFGGPIPHASLLASRVRCSR